MSRSSSARAAHLHAESNALEDIRTRLRIAQQHADELATQCRQLEARVQVSRALYMQEFFHSCPDDLLRCVFDAAVGLYDDAWHEFGYGYFNLDRAAIPFTLAAVCSRWRRVALGCPMLWTYVGIPDPPLTSACLQRLDLLLERSSPCALDILFSNAWIDYEILAEDDPLERCMAALSRQSARWKNVEMWLPESPNRELSDVFRGPLPVLAQLSFTSNTPSLDEALQVPSPRVTHLPFAPHLRYLELSFSRFALSNIYHPGFPSLLHFKCWPNCPAQQIARLLSLSQTTLRHLDVASENIPPFPLVMPNLRSLCLRDTAFFLGWPQPGLLFPGLTTLAVSSHVISPGLEPFLTCIASTVTRLELFDDLDTTALDTIKLLANLTHVAFIKPRSHSCTIAADFFVKIADAVPCIWPKLTNLAIGHSATVEPSNEEGILRLVNRRTMARTSQEATLLDVEVNYHGAPAWLVAEVARLLAASR